MRLAVYSTRPYDEASLREANAPHGHELVFFEAHLKPGTARLAQGCQGVCAFVNDQLSEPVLRELHAGGTRLVALRSAGFNHVDLRAAWALGMTVARVPAYSPYAVAEHAVGLVLMLCRRLHRAYNRVREANFTLDGLLGFDLHGKTVGVIGTGKIGAIFARIMHGFGCRVLVSDPHPDDEVATFASYVALDALLEQSDIVSLHCPLTPATHHLIDAAALERTKPGLMLINTSRGGLVDTRAVIGGLKSGHLGHLGLDVYEEEGDLFFEDLSTRVVQDDTFMRLLTFPNVVVTGHQAFFTREALSNIAETTLGNVTAFESGEGTLHAITREMLA